METKRQPIISNAPVVISKGVTLSIDPGTTVNLNNYYLQVDGTLRAVGTETNQIHINGPQQSTSAKINFTNTSPQLEATRQLRLDNFILCYKRYLD